MLESIIIVCAIIGVGASFGAMMHAATRRTVVEVSVEPADQPPGYVVDMCEICEEPATVAICEHEAGTGLQWTIVLCEDCFYDRLALLEHKPIDW